MLKRLLLTSGLVFGRMFCLCRPRLTFGYMQVSQINVRFLSIFCHINGKRLFSLKETFDRKIALLLKKSHTFALMLNELNFFRFYFIFFDIIDICTVMQAYCTVIVHICCNK